MQGQYVRFLFQGASVCECGIKVLAQRLMPATSSTGTTCRCEDLFEYRQEVKNEFKWVLMCEVYLFARSHPWLTDERLLPISERAHNYGLGRPHTQGQNPGGNR